MRDSGKGLGDITKRELVDMLLAEVARWTGEGPLEGPGRERARALLSTLGDCQLWLAEAHWRSLCGLWLARSDRPDPWLRDFWLGTLQQWQRYLAEGGYDPDARPLPPAAPFRRKPPYSPPEPGHLPFGFGKPV